MRTRLSALGLSSLGLVALLSASAQAAPPRPPHDVWIEAEACEEHDFTTIGRDPAFDTCYGNAILQLQTGAPAPADGYHATYRVTIPEAGYWAIDAATTKPDPSSLCAFSVEVTGYRPRRLARIPYTNEYGPGNILAWHRLGMYELDAGEAVITLRCNERRVEHGDYLLYLDALALRRAEPAPVVRHWVGVPDGEHGDWQLRTSLELTDVPRQSALCLLVDGGTAEVRIDGRAVGEHDDWQMAGLFFLDEFLHTGENVLELEVRGGDRTAVMAWVEVGGDAGSRRTLAATGTGHWEVIRDGTATAPVLRGHAYAAPWGDTTVQPRVRFPLSPLPIPVKTGNLSVDLIMAAAKGNPRPQPGSGAVFDEWRRYAAVSTVEDYICWLPLEPERGELDWSFYEQNCRELERRGMNYAVYPWIHFVPEWVEDSEFWDPFVCLEHGDPGPFPSIWAPATVGIFERFYGALHEHFGDRVREIFVSMVCDYGEVGYPVGMANWVVPRDHLHAGFWCGDRWAVADFQTDALRRYGSLDAVNAAWGTGFETEAGIEFPPWTGTEGPDFDWVMALDPADRAQVRQRWLDFADWYLMSMVEFAGKAVAASRKFYPEAPHEVKIGFGAEPVMFGADYTAYMARSERDGYVVRSTHGKLPMFYYRRFSTAAKHYGVGLVTEPPSNVSRDEEVERMFKDGTSGTVEYFDYPQNLLGATDLFGRFGRYMEGEHSLTDVAFFYPTTDHRLRTGQRDPAALQRACAAACDLFDWDLVDERLVRDGALERYRVLVWVEGQVLPADVLENITQWVENGGVLFCSASDPIETVTAETDAVARLLVSAESLPAVEQLGRHELVEPCPASFVRVGRLHDESLLSGMWHGPETGHFEWGGEPNQVMKRWTGPRCGIRLSTQPGEPATVAIAVARHPRLLDRRCEVLVNGAVVGTVAHERTSVFRATVPAERVGADGLMHVEIDTDGWMPRQVDEGSPDSRTLGVAVRWVKVWSGDAEPERPVLPQWRLTLDRERLLRDCVRRVGTGITVRFPRGESVLVRGIAELLVEPNGVLDSYPGLAVVDGERDGVWTALMPRRVLFYNGKDTAVSRTVTLDAERLAAWGVPIPEQRVFELEIPARALASIELPTGQVLRP